MNSAKNRRLNAPASLKSIEDDEHSLTGSNGTYFDSEDDMEYKPVTKRMKSIETSNGKKNAQRAISRRPTRVPDSKVTNRNALLARENRKRKKEMMETLEQTCEELEIKNKKLLKMMKYKDLREKKLLKEIQYLKSVIVNRTEIVSVLKSLPQQIPDTPKSQQKHQQPRLKKEINSDGFVSEASSATLSCEDDDDDKETIEIGKNRQSNENDDYLNVATEWDEILENPFSSATDFTDIPKFDESLIASPASNTSSPQSEISSEHNYYDSSSHEDEKVYDEQIDSTPGVCIHVRKGKVSLEFCSVCHFNATNAWVENIN